MPNTTTAIPDPVTASTTGHGASLSIRGVTKVYDTSTVVDDVSLEVEAGEFMTFLGPSGSGKTTTLNMIAGFTDVTEGNILMGGEPIERLPPYRRDIGMVFQSYALFPHLTVADNVAFPLRRRKVAKAETATRVTDALAMVRLEGLGGRYPNQLSGGQQQRVALARAIVFRPRVLLMDEPLGALDKKLREWLQLEIKRIHHDLGITFLYVTHDQEEALVLSDRIALFNDGKIEQLGSADDLYLRPTTRFAAEFLGESNLFTGTIDAKHPDVVNDEQGHRIRFAHGLENSGPGASATVIVRPEIARVLAGDAAADNVVSGTVEQVIYLGMARLLELRLPGGHTMLVREQAGAFSHAQGGDSRARRVERKRCTAGQAWNLKPVANVKVRARREGKAEEFDAGVRSGRGAAGIARQHHVRRHGGRQP